MTIFYVVIAALLLNAAYVSLTSERATTVAVLKNIRWWYFPVAGVVAAIAFVIAFLSSRIPYSSLSWLNLFGQSGGNVWTGPGVNGVEQATETGMNAVVFINIVLAFLIPAAIIFCLPRFAHFEEEIFRKFSESRSKRGILIVAFVFGAIHLIAGVPLFVIPALTFAGLVFTAIYLRAYRQNVQKVFDNRPLDVMSLAIAEKWNQWHPDRIVKISEEVAQAAAQIIADEDYPYCSKFNSDWTPEFREAKKLEAHENEVLRLEREVSNEAVNSSASFHLVYNLMTIFIFVSAVIVTLT